MHRLVTAVGLALLASLAVAAQSVYVPARVFVTAKKQFADVETMLADVSRADAVFLGEEHDDPNTHRVERLVLEGLARRRSGIILSLEMFERDAQESLEHFLMGHVEEADFLREAHAWPRYATDYKPLVDFAMSKQWPVVAANVPRAIATEVSKSGLEVLRAKPAEEQGWFARDLRCSATGPDFVRFRDAMADHDSSAPPLDAAAKVRYYLAQCLKDETMAESIASVYAAGTLGGKAPLVVSVNGSFHSDFRGGLVASTHRRMPGKRLVVISIRPVADLDRLSPSAEDRRRGDYLVYTAGTVGAH